MKYEKCSDCGGSGLRLNYNGEPDECLACGGDTVVEQYPSWDEVGPELLAALEGLVEWVEPISGDNQDELAAQIENATMKTALEAITKARSIK